MVATASTSARPLPDISVETAGKLKRLITEPGAVAAELWQNRNNLTLNVDHVGLRFILSLNGDNHSMSRVSPLICWLDCESVPITTLACKNVTMVTEIK